MAGDQDEVGARRAADGDAGAKVAVDAEGRLVLRRPIPKRPDDQRSLVVARRADLSAGPRPARQGDIVGSAAETVKLTKLLSAFEQTRSRPPTVEEVAKAMGWDLESARSALSALQPKTTSLLGRRPPALHLASPKNDRANGTAAVAIAKPKPGTLEARAWGRLRKRGAIPTAGAVAGEVRNLQAQAAVRDRLARHVAADGPRASAWVAQYWEQHGIGPLWKELAKAMGWPRKNHRHVSVIRRLGRAGWLEITEGVTRSLRPGNPE